jgi:hypothetical protein
LYRETPSASGHVVNEEESLRSHCESESEYPRVEECLEEKLETNLFVCKYIDKGQYQCESEAGTRNNQRAAFELQHVIW